VIGKAAFVGIATETPRDDVASEVAAFTLPAEVGTDPPLIAAQYKKPPAMSPTIDLDCNKVALKENEFLVTLVRTTRDKEGVRSLLGRLDG
jgi:hypothetical protein